MKKLFLFIALTLTFSKEAFALSFGGLGIRPASPDPKIPLSESWFIYNLLPGETKEDAFLVKNTSDETLTAKIYPVDATTTADGSFTLLSENEDRREIGAWVKLSQQQVTVGPGEEKITAFSIGIPENATVGNHLGGIVLENLATTKETGVNVVTRVGVRIYETVPGELIRKLKLENFTWSLIKDKLTFYFDCRNEGNVYLNPTAKLEIRDGFLGKSLATYDFSLGTAIPGKPTKVPFVWDKAWPLGKFTARVEIVFGEEPSEKVEKEISIFYLTGKARVTILLFAGLLVFLIFKVLLFSLAGV